MVNTMNNKFNDICFETLQMKIEESFLKEIVSKLNSFEEMYIHHTSKLELRKEKMDGLNPTCDIEYIY